METEVIKNTAITLKAYDDSFVGNTLDITGKMLLDSKVGDSWKVISGENHLYCVISMSATVVFKRCDGVALLVESVRCGDNPAFDTYTSDNVVWVRL